MSSKKVAIVHDWLVGGGAEKVIESLHQLYPDAPIYTSYCTDEWHQRLDHKVVTGYLQRWPFSVLRKFLPVIRSRWFRSLNLSQYDTIIVSSGNGEANHINAPKNAKVIFYCHTPTHYLWDKYNQYLMSPGFGIFNPIAKIGLRVFINPLKKRDFEAAQKADIIIANSTHTKDQIKKYYKRDSTVIHPPVDTQKFIPKHKTSRHGFITIGRQVPYKRTDLIVQACTILNLPLIVVGTGPEHSKLKHLAGSSVTFIEHADDAQLVELLQTSEAFIFASKEDFGIAPVEAMAAGCPVIAYHAGGALDYVMPNKTGIFFDKQSANSLQSALINFKTARFQERDLINGAAKFSKASFIKHMGAL